MSRRESPIKEQKFRLPTTNEMRQYHFIRIMVLLSLLPEILYAWFTQINASDGIKGTFKNIFGIDVSDDASDAAAWIFAALDFIINEILLNPNQTARDAVGIKLMKDKLYAEIKDLKEEIKKDPESCCFLAYKFITTRFLPYLGMLFNFPVGAFADYLPLNERIKDIPNSTSRKSTAIIVASTLVILGVSYYLALSHD